MSLKKEMNLAEREYCKEGKLDGMFDFHIFAIVYDGTTVRMQIRYNTYTFSKVVVPANKLPDDNRSRTGTLCYQMGRKDIKTILKIVRANVKKFLSETKAMRIYIHDVMLPEEDSSYPYFVTAIERQLYKDPTFELLTIKEAETMERGITYFLDNIHAWEAYHSMSLTMNLTDSNNCRLEKETYLP